MRRDEVISKLLEHREELEAAGVAHLRLFGSVARGDDTPSSDVDMIADLDPAKPLSLIGFPGIQVRLASILETPVDLTSEKWLKERVKRNALRDSVVAF